MKIDCCIVGGGPAGAVLALLLVRKGVSVLLLEAHKDFDREFRGDTIHPSVMEILDQLGLADRLLELRHSRISSLTVRTDQGNIKIADLNGLKTRFPYITILPQVKFLEFITAEAARYPGFKLLMGASAQELIEEEGGVRGIRYRDDQGLHEARATLTVGADGRFSRLRQLAGLELKKTSPPMDVLWFRLPRKESDQEGGMGRISRGRMFVMLDRFDYWQIGYVIPKGEYQKLHSQEIDALRRVITQLVPEFADRVGELKDWKQVSLLVVEAGRLERWYRPGLLLIGDAAHVMSPVGGVGINYAIQDAVVAANILAEPLKSGSLQVEDLGRVQRKREWPTKVIQLFQTLMQKRVVSNALNSQADFRLPLFLRLPFVRNRLVKMLAFGVTKVHVED